MIVLNETSRYKRLLAISTILLAAVANLYHAVDPYGNYINEYGWRRGFSPDSLVDGVVLIMLPSLLTYFKVYFNRPSNTCFYAFWSIAFCWSSLWLLLYLTD